MPISTTVEKKNTEVKKKECKTESAKPSGKLSIVDYFMCRLGKVGEIKLSRMVMWLLAMGILLLSIDIGIGLVNGGIDIKINGSDQSRINEKNDSILMLTAKLEELKKASTSNNEIQKELKEISKILTDIRIDQKGLKVNQENLMTRMNVLEKKIIDCTEDRKDEGDKN